MHHVQPRELSPALEGLPALPSTGYHYVLLHVWFITVTHRCASWQLNATLPKLVKYSSTNPVGCHVGPLALAAQVAALFLH